MNKLLSSMSMHRRQNEFVLGEYVPSHEYIIDDNRFT